MKSTPLALSAPITNRIPRKIVVLGVLEGSLFPGGNTINLKLSA